MKKGALIYFFIFLLLTGISYSVPDADADGVPDNEDKCPNSITNVVNQFGCGCEELNCPPTNNPCIEQCTPVNGLPTCGVYNDKPCPGGLCQRGKCIRITPVVCIFKDSTETEACYYRYVYEDSISDQIKGCSGTGTCGFNLTELTNVERDVIVSSTCIGSYDIKTNGNKYDLVFNCGQGEPSPLIKEQVKCVFQQIKPPLPAPGGGPVAKGGLTSTQSYPILISINPSPVKTEAGKSEIVEFNVINIPWEYVSEQELYFAIDISPTSPKTTIALQWEFLEPVPEEGYYLPPGSSKIIKMKLIVDQSSLPGKYPFTFSVKDLPSQATTKPYATEEFDVIVGKLPPKEERCYSNKGECSGVDSCIVDVSGEKGEKVEWKSSCGGYAYTVIDGIKEQATFYCGLPPDSGEKLSGSCKNPNGGTYCGFGSGTGECFCDDACTQFGDCCFDYKDICRQSCFELSSYPSMFFVKNIFDGYIVVGDKAPASDVIAAAKIAASLKSYEIGIDNIKLSSEIADITSVNAIVVGNACTNPAATVLLGYPQDCTQNLNSGYGYLTSYQNYGLTQILVSGLGDRETKAASSVLINFKDYSGKIKGTKIQVDALTQEIQALENNCAVDSKNPDVLLYQPTSGKYLIEFGDGLGNFKESNVGFWPENAEVKPAWFNFDVSNDNPLLMLTDFLIYNKGNGAWSKAINLNSGQFLYNFPSWSPDWSTYILDLNGDYLSDVFLYNKNIGWYFRCINIPGGFDCGTREQWSPGWNVYPVNLNSDVPDDLFLYNPNTGQWFKAYNEKQGPNEFGFKYYGETWDPGWDIYPGNFNDDFITDFFLYNPNSPTNNWFIAATDGTGFNYVYGTLSMGWNINIANFNGDGFADVFLYNPSNGLWFEVINQEPGLFTESSYYKGSWLTGRQSFITDFNNDGLSDVLFYDPSKGQYETFINIGLGNFTYNKGNWGSGHTVITSQTNIFSVTNDEPIQLGLMSLPSSPPTPTILTCDQLQKNQPVHFASCNSQGYDKVCFNKITGEYQGCGKSSYDDCTINNINANKNIWCNTGTLKTCIDTDGGFNYYVKGTATGLGCMPQSSQSSNTCLWEIISLSDSCVRYVGGNDYSDSGPELIEQTCEGEKIIGQRITCPNGCSNGACIALCGNGITEGGEQCDGPNQGSCPAKCSTSCIINKC